MKSQRPYILRALLEWIADNNQTPYVVVSAEQKGVHVPRNYVQDGQIVLNISSTAVRDLRIDNETLQFDGRFGGNPIRVTVPVGAVVALYARETGDGMVFDLEEREEREQKDGHAALNKGVQGAGPQDSEEQQAGSHLRLVK